MKNFIFVFLLLFGYEHANAAVKLTLDRDASIAEFLAIGKPSALKIRGTKGKPEGQLMIDGEAVKGELLLTLSDFETGIGLRDKHMKEKYLEVEKEGFRQAKLRIKTLSLPKEFWQSPRPQTSAFKGILFLHGVEKEIEGALEIAEAAKDALNGVAKFTILLPDFGISIPSFSGITVAEKVDLEIKFKSRVESL